MNNMYVQVRKLFLSMLSLFMLFSSNAFGGYWVLGHDVGQTVFDFAFTYPDDRTIQIIVTGRSFGSTIVYAASCSNIGAGYSDISGMSLPKKLILKKNGVSVDLPLLPVTSPVYTSANQYVFGSKLSTYNSGFVCKYPGVNPDTTPVGVGPYKAVLQASLPLNLTEGIWTGQIAATTAFGQRTYYESDNIVWQSIAERSDVTGSGSFSVPVSIDVPEPPVSCSIFGDDVSFGELSPVEISGRSKRTVITVNCNKKTSGSVRLSGGYRYEGNNYMSVKLLSGFDAHVKIKGKKIEGVEINEDFYQGMTPLMLETELHLTGEKIGFGEFNSQIIATVQYN
ncbi:hypothetical protein E2G14_09390 [Salmonella enterica subsp. enterica serovar Reading]|nr:hypothetical protein [Salmonella enterica subsp. enterica serovar Reading]